MAESSLAIDTLHAMSQQWFLEGLSPFVRKYLVPDDRPDVDSITGLGTSLAVDQQGASQNPNTTVGSLVGGRHPRRLLYSRVRLRHRRRDPWRRSHHELEHQPFLPRRRNAAGEARHGRQLRQAFPLTTATHLAGFRSRSCSRPRPPFYVASVAKQFTGAAIATLIHDGVVALDQPVATWLAQQPWLCVARRDRPPFQRCYPCVVLA